jgi:hypothetical protein
MLQEVPFIRRSVLYAPAVEERERERERIELDL